MKYRPEIDGLRAVAVIPVVLFHAGFSFFEGGFVGVDVFFVISGYLITSIIVAHQDTGSFSLLNFYKKRALRILPPLLFVCALSIPLSFMILPPHALKDYFQSLISVATFTSNIFFYIETDYFNDFSESAPLLHTWSLAVEEQFYIILPSLLLLLAFVSKSIRFLVLLFVVILSFYSAQYFNEVDISFSFYMLLTRFWELGFGVLIALVPSGAWIKRNDVLCDLFSVLGLALIFLSVYELDKTVLFPGLAALPVVLGAALVIFFSEGGKLVKSLLSNTLLVYIGLASYSIYLFHQPIFAFLRVSLIDFDNAFVKTVAIFSLSGFSYLSYRFIETPFRKLSKVNCKLLLIIFLSLLFVFVGYIGHKTNGFKSYILGKISDEMSSKIVDVSAGKSGRKGLVKQFQNEAVLAFSNSTETKKILVLGDSKSNDFFISASLEPKLYEKYEIRRLRFNDDCMGYPKSATSKECEQEQVSVFNSNLLSQADEIILTATWQHATLSRVLDFIEWLNKRDKKIKLVSTANFNDVASLSYIIAKKSLENNEVASFLYENIRQDWRKKYFSLKSKIEQSGFSVIFLEKLDVFCELGEKACRLSDSSKWYIYDSGHVTVRGARHFGKKIHELNWLE